MVLKKAVFLLIGAFLHVQIYINIYETQLKEDNLQIFFKLSISGEDFSNAGFCCQGVQRHTVHYVLRVSWYQLAFK